MKQIILFLCVATLSACAVTKNGNTKTLKLTKATSQFFRLGTPVANGKGIGTTYSMYFTPKTAIAIEKVWINGKNMDFERSETNAEGAFMVRSTIYNQYKRNIHENVKEPIEHTGEGLVQYKENNETKYYIIKEFKKYSFDILPR